MRKLLITIAAALALATAVVPAGASADAAGPAIGASAPSDVALRPTAIEYGLIF